MMTKIDKTSLEEFNLHFPGIWIDGEDRDWAFQVRHALRLVEDLFVEAVAAYALFQPITSENIHEVIKDQKSRYEECLDGLYAKAFVFALHSIEKLLHRLSAEDMHSPSGVQSLYDDYRHQFGHLKHIRDSAIHIEDRGLGVTRDRKRIQTSILVIGCFIEKRFTFSGEDGKHYEIEISDKTLNSAKSIIQNVINSYQWISIPMVRPEKEEKV